VTPIPDDVAATIVAAGHSLQATAEGAWTWGRSGGHDGPSWLVFVGHEGGRGRTARDAVLAALARVAKIDDDWERKAREEWKRVRLPYRKAQELERAEGAAKRAADVRALAATVAAMWPEVTP
jgi:hypothetical protein